MYKEGQKYWIRKDLLIAQGYTGSTKKLWIPKRPSQEIKPKAQPQPKRSKAKRNPQRTANGAKAKPTSHSARYVPKDLLKAQGYYQGNTQVWLPKQKSPARQQQVLKVTRQSAPSPPKQASATSMIPTQVILAKMIKVEKEKAKGKGKAKAIKEKQQQMKHKEASSTTLTSQYDASTSRAPQS